MIALSARIGASFWIIRPFLAAIVVSMWGATGYFVALGEPLHSDVTGDAAYIISPATIRFKVRNKQQVGANFYYPIRKQANGWRIAARAWATGTPQSN
jgi:hypothetical protein